MTCVVAILNECTIPDRNFRREFVKFFDVGFEI